MNWLTIIAIAVVVVIIFFNRGGCWGR